MCGYIKYFYILHYTSSKELDMVTSKLGLVWSITIKFHAEIPKQKIKMCEKVHNDALNGSNAERVRRQTINGKT